MDRFDTDIFNKLLLLAIIKESTNNVLVGATRLQKLVFLCELHGRKKKIDTFNYTFYRWNYGPYSKELQDDVSEMCLNRYLLCENNEPRRYTLTNLGHNFLERYKDSISIETLGLITEYLRNYQDVDIHKLMQNVYKITQLEQKYQIGETILYRKEKSYYDDKRIFFNEYKIRLNEDKLVWKK